MSDDGDAFDFSVGDNSSSYYYDSSSSGSGGSLRGALAVLALFGAAAFAVTSCNAVSSDNKKAAAVDQCAAQQNQDQSFGTLYSYRNFSDLPKVPHYVNIVDGHLTVTQITGSKEYYGPKKGVRYFTDNFGFNLNDRSAPDTFGEGHIDTVDGKSAVKSHQDPIDPGSPKVPASYGQIKACVDKYAR